MQKVQQHWDTLKTAVIPLPEVARKPALLKLWLVDFSVKRLIILSALLLIVLLADPFSQWLVDYYYPLDQGSFSTTLQEIFNSSSIRQLEAQREERYIQYYSTINLLAFLSLIVFLLLDLPSVIKRGKAKADELIEQSKSIHESDPQLAETLVIEATQLLLKPGEIAATVKINTGKTSAQSEPLAKTAKAAPQEERFVGPKQRYRIITALAKGGAGIVYEAEDTLLERRVALKELFENVASDPELAERFKVEAKALAKLNHPHILPVYDMVEENGHFWLVMELLKGGTLNDKIKKAGTLDIAESIHILKGIAAGLGIAHQHDFIHRDIKPANILFATDGGYRITDFGIAKSKSSVIKTQHGVVMGSPAYMSPEQASGEEVDPRSDIYSLGITMYQMITGKLPFVGDTMAVLAQHFTQIPKKPSLSNMAIAPELEAVIMKMVEKKPEDRYQSTDELIKALNRLESSGSDL